MKNQRIQTKRKTVLLTGTTSGIGLELTRLFAANDFNLVLVSRDDRKLESQKNDLKQQYQVDVYTIAKDLAERSAPGEIFAAVQSQKIQVDILVNNAGFNVSGLFNHTDAEQELKMLDVMVVALTNLTKLFVPGMVQRGYGKILNLGSTGSFAPCPLDAVYAAAKAYVLSFSKAIRAELAGTGVTVSVLCPGATRTEFPKKAQIENTRLFNSFVMEPRTVAKQAYHGLMKNRKVIITGLYNKLLVQSIKFTPSAILDKLTFMLLARRESKFEKRMS